MLLKLFRRSDSIRLKRPLFGRSSVHLNLRSVRPSLTDWRFKADAWIVDQGDGTLALRLGDYNFASINGSPFDLPVLNQILERVWHRRPRRRS